MTAALVIFALAGSTADSRPNSPRISCGPEGKPALGGSVCIDRMPVRIELCGSARRAVAFYRRRTWELQDEREGAHSDRTPLVRGRSCHWANYAAGVWSSRARSARKALDAYRWEYAWRLWLPTNWSAVARCETGYNWSHANSVYVSAFGISRREYDADAAVYGAAPWNDARPPTPHDQYLAARGHYARFGDGWTCPGP